MANHIDLHFGVIVDIVCLAAIHKKKLTWWRQITRYIWGLEAREWTKKGSPKHVNATKGYMHVFLLNFLRIKKFRNHCTTGRVWGLSKSVRAAGVSVKFHVNPSNSFYFDQLWTAGMIRKMFWSQLFNARHCKLIPCSALSAYIFLTVEHWGATLKVNISPGTRW